MRVQIRTVRNLGVAALLSILACSLAFSADVKLAWDANTEPTLAGYKVYYGTASRVYGTPTPVGNVTTYTVTGLGAGTYYFAVTALDKGGQESGYSNEVFTTIGGADTIPPAVSITSPTSGGSYTATSATLRMGGIASDNVGVTQVSWSNNRGGSGVAAGTTAWSVTGIVLQVGTNVIIVTARDAAGNTATATLTATYAPGDSTPPTIAFTSPTSGTTYSTRSTPLAIGGTASDNVGVTQVTWANNRGGSGTATGTTSWSAAGVALQSGSNVITVTASDAAGNKGTASLTVTYNPTDTTAPTVIITPPTSNPTYITTSSPISMSGTASDNVGVTQVTWANNRGGSGTATGTTSWNVASVALQSGSNLIAVTASDAAGNKGTATLTVTYTPPDTTAPTVAITSPTSNPTYSTMTSPLTISGSASDNAGVSLVTWVSSRGTSGTATGTTSWSVSGIALQNGSNVITVTARDAAGNSGTAQLTVSYPSSDNAPPVISGVGSIGVSSTKARIYWTTNEPATSLVDHGISPSYGSTVSNGTLVTSHSLDVSGLTLGSVYHFRVKSADAVGNTSVSMDYTFTFSVARASKRIFPYPKLKTGTQQAPGGVKKDEYMGVALTNTNTVTATLTFTALDVAGNPLFGPGITNPATRTLKPGNQLPIVDSELFGADPLVQDTAGWIRVDSDVDGVTGLFLMFDSVLTELDGGSLSTVPLSSFLLPELEDQGFSKLTIMNTNGQPGTLTFDLVRADGTVRASTSRPIPSNGSMVADVSGDLFTDAPPALTDYIRVASTLAVYPVEMVGRSGQDMAALSGLDRESGALVLYSPQYAVGGPWRSSLSVINLDPIPGTITLRFFDENGAPIGSPRVLDISANGKIRIDDQSFFSPVGQDVLQGYVQITSSGVRLTGSIVFGDVQGKSFTSALHLVQALSNSILFGHLASNDTYFTGIALVNPSDSELSATIDLYGADGLLQGSKPIKIPARQRKSGLMTEFFPELIGKDRTSGYVKVTGDGGMAGFALFGTNKLSVLSAIPPQITP